MKCKIFKIRLQNESDELKLNKFLAEVELKQVFASVVNEEGHFWSALVFYEDEKTAVKSFPQKETAVPTADNIFALPANQSSSSAIPPAEKPAPEPIILTPQQETDFNNLKKWRNERAAQDGLAPYMIAHNDSLRQIAAMPVRTKEDFLQIKGFGEKRAEKYAEEILRILGIPAGEFH